MSVDTATLWLGFAALAICVLIGTAIGMATVRTAWVAKSISSAMIGFGVVALAFLSAPKWQKLTITADKDGGVNATLARLESENLKLRSENAGFREQIAQVASLNTVTTLSAQEAIGKIENAKRTVGWAEFLPSQSDFWVAVNEKDASQVAPLAQALGVSTQQVSQALESADYTVLKKPSPSDLLSVPAGNLWAQPAENRREKSDRTFAPNITEDGIFDSGIAVQPYPPEQTPEFERPIFKPQDYQGGNDSDAGMSKLPQN